MAAALVWLGGCTADSPEAVLDDYLSRVENTLDVELPRGDRLENALPLPGKRHRRLPITDLRTGVLETLDFRLCHLLPLIAERNSSLGRVMKPSTRLRYELRFFDGLSGCYLQDQAHPLKDEAFSALLARIYQTKADNLAHEVWNGIFTSESLEKNLSLSSPPLPLEGDTGHGDSVRALQALGAIQTQVRAFEPGQPFFLPPGLDTLETRYETLYHSEYGSKLFKSLALLTHYLDHTAATIEAALERRPICFGGPTERGRILKNVFSRYYAGRVQTYLSRVHRQGGPWIEQLRAMTHDTGLVLSAPLQHYLRQMVGKNNEEGLWGGFQKALRHHTQAWQSVLKQCNLMPQAPT